MFLLYLECKKSIFYNMFQWTQKLTSSKYVNFENVQDAVHSNQDIILINTMPSNEQSCLIKNTVHANDEEQIINDMLFKLTVPDKPVFIYGKNDSDYRVDEKYNNLKKIGVESVYIYKGGMFEWMLLQDIYGKDEFPTTSKLIDILSFRPAKIRIVK